MNEKRKIIVKDISPSLISQRQTREILMSLTLECFFALYIVGFLVVILLVVGVMAEETSKVDDSVYSALNNKDYVPVVIKVKEDTKKSMFFTQNSTKEVEENLENEPLGRYRNLIAANISKEELDKLENLGSIERIEYAPSFKAMLQDSVGVVNASRSWSLKLSGSNITGADETVCVIDTGIDFSHPDLIGKNKTCIIDCFNKACIENCSLADANGHGTHVAGIIAASPGIRGVAFSAGLIGVRVLDSSGGSSDTPTLDLKRAIDWCIQNRLNYNISVISMSLGTSTLYDSACDSDFSATWTRAINNATYYNISVISASGNADSGPRNTTHISAPACITNVTAVSATDKNDAISSYGHYGTMVDLFAPGTSINSTYPGNGYAILSGTSMSTPQVAAAFALIREFYRLQTGLVYTPLQIQTAFQNNGKNISGSGLNFTRINIYDTIISLDSQSPNVLLITPQNNSAVLNRNQTFRCNSTDISLKNITFFLWNSTGLVNSSVKNISGVFNQFEINLTNITLGNYDWNCLYSDEKGNSAFQSSNFSISINDLNVDLISPLNGSITNQNKSFTCNATSNNALTNVTFFLWNSTGLVNSSFRAVSGITNSTNFSASFSAEGSYMWNCLYINSMGNQNFANANYSIQYDTNAPVISAVTPQNSSWGNGIFNVSLNGAGSCLYSLNGGITNVSMNISDSSNRSFFSINSSLTNNQQYNVSYYCNDSAGNVAFSAINFLFDDTKPQVFTLSPSDGDSSNIGTTTVGFKYNVSDNLNITGCVLIIGGSVSSITSNSSTITNGTNTISHDLAAGSYNWVVNCTDQAGNIGNSSIRSITINSAVSVSSSGGGGGGGGISSIQEYSVTADQTSKGYTKDIKLGESISFEVPSNSAGKVSERHSVKINRIGKDFVNITIRSNVIEAVLMIGQSLRVNLTSSEYYDVYVKLENIVDGKAVLTIKTIHEDISKAIESNTEDAADSNTSQLNQTNVPESNKGNSARILIKIVIYVISVVLLIFIIGLINSLVINRKKRKNTVLKHSLF